MPTVCIAPHRVETREFTINVVLGWSPVYSTWQPHKLFLTSSSPCAATSKEGAAVDASKREMGYGQIATCHKQWAGLDCDGGLAEEKGHITHTN